MAEVVHGALICVKSKDLNADGSYTIPDGVTKIGKYAFQNCRNLTSITIPDGITKICDSAFQNCSSLTLVTIPDGVTEIDLFAFKNCSRLISITIPNSVTSISNYAFDGCSDLTSIIIPYGVTSIGKYAFKGCSGLASITIPDSVTKIGFYAFEGCSGLTSITIPYSLISNSRYTFKDYSGLTSITIPDGVTKIDVFAFKNCSRLISITIPNSVTSISSYAFDGCSDLTSIIIPNSVTSIGDYAFKDCSGLTSITIPDSVTSIGYDAFAGCSGLTSITIPDSLISIGRHLLENYGSLITSITIPDGVTSIRSYVFCHCSRLTSITIPDSVTSINYMAFKNCDNISQINVKDVNKLYNGSSLLDIVAQNQNISMVNALLEYPNINVDMGIIKNNAMLDMISRSQKYSEEFKLNLIEKLLKKPSFAKNVSLISAESMIDFASKSKNPTAFECINRILSVYGMSLPISLQYADGDVLGQAFFECINRILSVYGMSLPISLQYADEDVLRHAFKEILSTGGEVSASEKNEALRLNYLSRMGRNYQVFEAERQQIRADVHADSDSIVGSAKMKFKKLEEHFETMIAGRNKQQIIFEYVGKIKVKLLKDILADKNTKEETKQFIIDNREQLILDNCDAQILKEAHENHFNDKNDTNHTAWRAFDQHSPTSGYYRSFFAPSSGATALETTFVTRVAYDTEGAFTNEIASSEMRYYACLAYMAATDDDYMSEGLRADIWNDFKSYVFLAVREYSSPNGDDAPSCFPGQIARMGLSISKHPVVAPISAMENRQEQLQESVARIATNTFSQLTPEYKLKYFDALTFISDFAATAIAGLKTDENSVSYGISGEQKHSELLKLRREFIQKMGDFGGISKKVNDDFQRLNHQLISDIEQKTLCYLIANSGSLSKDRFMADLIANKLLPANWFVKQESNEQFPLPKINIVNEEYIRKFEQHWLFHNLLDVILGLNLEQHWSLYNLLYNMIGLDTYENKIKYKDEEYNKIVEVCRTAVNEMLKENKLLSLVDTKNGDYKFDKEEIKLALEGVKDYLARSLEFAIDGKEVEEIKENVPQYPIEVPEDLNLERLKGFVAAQEAAPEKRNSGLFFRRPEECAAQQDIEPSDESIGSRQRYFLIF